MDPSLKNLTGLYKPDKPVWIRAWIWIILIGSRDTNDFVNPSICKHEFKFTCRGYCRFILKLVIVVAVIALKETMLYRQLLFNLIKILLMFNISENSEQTKSCKSFLSGWCKCIRTLRTFIVIKLCRTPGMDFRICQKMTKADYLILENELCEPRGGQSFQVRQFVFR